LIKRLQAWYEEVVGVPLKVDVRPDDGLSNWSQDTYFQGFKCNEKKD
jgi:hypothetical protein